MKNFSEILDTTYNITVNLCLEPVYKQEPPIVCVTWVTDIHHKITEYEDTQILMDAKPLHEPKDWTLELPILDTCCLRVSLMGKIDNLDPTTGIEIKSLTFDDFNIMPQYTHYSTYKNDRNYIEPVGHLGFNGTWEVLIPIPFYQWRHQITGCGWLLYQNN
jgi:hypothetical protein